MLHFMTRRLSLLLLLTMPTSFVFAGSEDTDEDNRYLKIGYGLWYHGTRPIDMEAYIFDLKGQEDDNGKSNTPNAKQMFDFLTRKANKMQASPKGSEKNIKAVCFNIFLMGKNGDQISLHTDGAPGKKEQLTTLDNNKLTQDDAKKDLLTYLRGVFENNPFKERAGEFSFSHQEVETFLQEGFDECVKADSEEHAVTQQTQSMKMYFSINIARTNKKPVVFMNSEGELVEMSLKDAHIRRPTISCISYGYIIIASFIAFVVGLFLGDIRYVNSKVKAIKRKVTSLFGGNASSRGKLKRDIGDDYKG